MQNPMMAHAKAIMLAHAGDSPPEAAQSVSPAKLNKA